jgi:hypothetical protein
MLRLERSSAGYSTPPPNYQAQSWVRKQVPGGEAEEGEEPDHIDHVVRHTPEATAGSTPRRSIIQGNGDAGEGGGNQRDYHGDAEQEPKRRVTEPEDGKEEADDEEGDPVEPADGSLLGEDARSALAAGDGRGSGYGSEPLDPPRCAPPRRGS